VFLSTASFRESVMIARGWRDRDNAAMRLAVSKRRVDVVSLAL
jgi:hypothetical protein